MHLLVCSYEYGRNANAEGICTERLVHALLDAGFRITVLTSHRPGQGCARTSLNIIATPPMPFPVGRLLRVAERHLKRNLTQRLWYFRVLATRILPKFDAVYARSGPPISLKAGAFVARKIHAPLICHFSDPMPNPWLVNKRHKVKALSFVRSVVQAANALTFTTEEAITYMGSQLGFSIEHKARVVKHIAPEPLLYPTSNGADNPVFLYTGTFYVNRKPDTLLKAFSLFQTRCPGARLHIVGASPESLSQAIDSHDLGGACVLFPRTTDLSRFIEQATVLVALDADDASPMFLTTKLIEYLMTNRPVLLISPSNSPGTKLLSRFPGTAFAVEHDPFEIAQVMKLAVSTRKSDEQYLSRFSGMGDFHQAGVVNVFRQLMADIQSHGPFLSVRFKAHKGSAK